MLVKYIINFLAVVVLLQLLRIVQSKWDGGEIPKYYRALGINPLATSKDIRKAFRQLSVSRHPDKIVGPGTTEQERDSAQKEFILLAKAYDILSDEVKRKRYDYLTEEHGWEIDYLEGYDYSIIDQNLDIASMHHRDTSKGREKAGSRVWSMEEAELLFHESEELAQLEDLEKRKDEDQATDPVLVAGFIFTLAVSILVPYMVHKRREREKEEEKMKKKGELIQQEKDLIREHAQAVAKLIQEEEEQKRLEKEEMRARNKLLQEEEAQRKVGMWAQMDPKDPFLHRLSWLSQEMSYDKLWKTVMTSTKPDDVESVLLLLESFRSYIGENKYEGAAWVLLGFVIDVQRMELDVKELWATYFEGENGLKLDDTHEKIVKQSLLGSEEEEAALRSLQRIQAVAIERLRQAGGNIKGLKEDFDAWFFPKGVGLKSTSFLSSAQETSVTVKDVLQSRVASSIFEEHVEYEGRAGDLALYRAVTGAMAVKDKGDDDAAAVFKEAVSALLCRFFGEEGEGPLPSGVESLQDIAEALQALVDASEGVEVFDAEQEELLTPLLGELVQQVKGSLEDSLHSFVRHTYDDGSGGRPNKSKLYSKLLKAACTVLPPPPVALQSAADLGSGSTSQSLQHRKGKGKSRKA